MEQKPKNVSPMSNEGRNAYVIGQLTDALLSLPEEKPLEGISVSEWCDGAGVGRTSFYRNFACKEDILKAYIGELFHGWMDRWEEGLPLEELILRVFSHFEAHRAFYSLLNERGQVYLLKDVILDLCGFDPQQEAVAAYASAFAAFSLYGWIEVWFRRGMRESAEELRALFSRAS